MTWVDWVMIGAWIAGTIGIVGLLTKPDDGTLTEAERELALHSWQIRVRGAKRGVIGGAVAFCGALPLFLLLSYAGVIL